MVEVKGTTITITKGDSGIITVGILNADGTPYVPQVGDVVRFAMKKNYSDAETLIEKNIPLETMELRLDPVDTKNLEAGSSKGKYKYDIELTRADGQVDTFIPRADFVVLEEVK